LGEFLAGIAAVRPEQLQILERIVELIEPLPTPASAPPAQFIVSPDDGAPLPASTTERCDWFDPLLDDVMAGRVLRSSLQTWCDRSRIDVEATTRMMSRLQPLTRVPRRGRWALRRGAQVLVDNADAMTAFAADQSDLVQRVRALGRSDIVVVPFHHLPTAWGSYTPPARKAPVLILTDLGIGGPASDPWRASPDEWREFATMLARRQSRVVALVPYRPSRVPASLQRRIDVLEWDRTVNIPRRGRRRTRGQA